VADTVVGADGGLAQVMQRVEQVARADVPVLVLGETGSGKEVVAREIHHRSARAKGPFLRVNCGAIPPELVDSELFGHERGAFTGAIAVRKGWFERADGGTLFLDEIGELPAAAQVRLLRVLQDGSIQRVGGQDTHTVDVRIVAATHRDLTALQRAGAFREDLWYRISVFPIRLPPLRERKVDLPALARVFAARAGQRLHGRPLVPTPADLTLLQRYDWPGNVRELAAVIERAAILGGGDHLDVSAALGVAPAPPAEPTDERGRIEATLERCLGRIEGPFGAAAALGEKPGTLRSRMRRLGIDWERYRPRHREGTTNRS
jgi:transcriptional regulator with GAF, ATPase, and Fis domain